MISHEMTRTMETALAEWVRAQAVPLVLAADTEDEAAAVIELLAWAPEQPFNAAPPPLYEASDRGFLARVVADTNPVAEDLAIWLAAMAWDCSIGSTDEHPDCASDPLGWLWSMAKEAAKRQATAGDA